MADGPRFGLYGLDDQVGRRLRRKRTDADGRTVAHVAVPAHLRCGVGEGEDGA